MSRLASVRHEMEGSATSELQRETGLSVRVWGGYVYRFVTELADQFDFDPLSLLVIRHYALVSAIYEWAAVNEGDAFDAPAFWGHVAGGYQSPSVGPFQGYPERGAWALANDASLATFVRTDPRTRGRPWASLAWDRLAGDGTTRPVVQGRIPQPQGTYRPDDWPALRWDGGTEDALRTAQDPFFSLIGKVELSMACSQEVVRAMGADRYRQRLPPQLRRGMARHSTPQSSDPVSLWLLATYEFADHDMHEVRENLDKLAYAFDHPGHVVTLNPIADVERPRAAFRAVGITFAETFLCDEAQGTIRPLVGAS